MNLYKHGELREFYLSLGKPVVFTPCWKSSSFSLEHVFQETSLSVLTTADLLRERLAFITGGTSEQCPILTFPDNPLIELTQEKYKKLVAYLTQVPR